MKNAILIVMMLWSIFSASAQVSANAWDSLTYWIEKEIKATKVDLERSRGSIEFKYRKGESSGLRLTNKLDYATEESVMSMLSSRVPVSLYVDQDSLHLRASYQFDEFTGELFFTSWSNLYITTEKIFGGYRTLYPEAPGGMGRFLKRWTAYVNQLVPIDTPTKYTSLGKIRWLSFDVDLDGSLIPRDSNPSDSILSTFLKNEKKWRPCINYGRKVRMRMSLALPEKISHLYATHWSLDLVIDPKMDEYAYNLHDQSIFVADHTLSQLDGINVISMLNDHGEVASVRYHQGDFDACQEMEELIQNSDSIKDYNVSHGGNLQRIYFYTYAE